MKTSSRSIKNNQSQWLCPSQRSTTLFCEQCTMRITIWSSGLKGSGSDWCIFYLVLWLTCSTFRYRIRWDPTWRTSIPCPSLWQVYGFGFIPSSLCGGPIQSLKRITCTLVYYQWSSTPSVLLWEIRRSSWIWSRPWKPLNNRFRTKQSAWQKHSLGQSSRSQGWWELHGWLILESRVAQWNSSTKESNIKCLSCWVLL